MKEKEKIEGFDVTELEDSELEDVAGGLLSAGNGCGNGCTNTADCGNTCGTDCHNDPPGGLA